MGSKFQKSKSGFRISILQYFGSNIIEGVAESWVEAEMSLVEVGGGGWSWVEVDARFSNTLLKEIYGICETKNSTKKQVKEYKMTKREVYKKFTNLIENELNR